MLRRDPNFMWSQAHLQQIVQHVISKLYYTADCYLALHRRVVEKTHVKSECTCLGAT